MTNNYVKMTNFKKILAFLFFYDILKMQGENGYE